MSLRPINVVFAIQKLESVCIQIELLRASDFPYKESRDALELLLEVYKENIELLGKLSDSSDGKVVISACSRANHIITKFKSILGFILRSTNVRNAFEIYDPLLRLCRQLLGEDAKLILSSEWTFSPYTYPAVFEELPQFALIGLPASESGNALVIPLAGHELGHSVWRNTEIGKLEDLEIQSKVENEFLSHWDEFERHFDSADKNNLLTDLFLRQKWTFSYKLAQRQCEELFCDFLGVRLFGESFLYSFLYLISPNLGVTRSLHYPNLENRAAYLEKACGYFNFETPPDFCNFFSDIEPKLSDEYKFLLSMADKATHNMVDVLLDRVAAFCNQRNAPLPTDAERDEVEKQFALHCPANNAKCLGDVVNAGWRVRLSDQISEENKEEYNKTIKVLNDLIYKTVEIMEYNCRVSGG